MSGETGPVNWNSILAQTSTMQGAGRTIMGGNTEKTPGAEKGPGISDNSAISSGQDPLLEKMQFLRQKATRQGYTPPQVRNLSTLMVSVEKLVSSILASGMLPPGAPPLPNYIVPDTGNVTPSSPGQMGVNGGPPPFPDQLNLPNIPPLEQVVKGMTGMPFYSPYMSMYGTGMMNPYSTFDNR
jgi:hypothetical protein